MILEKAKKVVKNVLALDTKESLDETMQQLSDIKIPDLSDGDTVIVCEPTEEVETILCNNQKEYIEKKSNDSMAAAAGGRLVRGES